MSLTQLLGGPDWDVVTNPDYALFADFHYFFNSGSVIRSNPWNSPQTPAAKILNVRNITANDVALNYVNTSGSIVATALSASESRTITSQTLPLGLDNNAWLSASFVSNYTGSIVARPTGSRWFELESIRSVTQDTYVYTIPDGATTITRTNTGQPSVGSLRYRCSRTIPYLDQPFWLIRDLYDCTGGTTTTTTSTSTTTTTTTLAPGCFIYNVRNNGVGTGFVNYVYCDNGSTYQQFSLPGGGSGSICVDNYQINDGGNLQMVFTLTSASCNATTTTTTTTTSTTTTTLAPTTTTTTTIAPYCRVWTATNAFGSSYNIRVKYCGDTTYSFPTVPANGGIVVCVQNDQIDNNGNPILLTSGSTGCSGSIITTTTTTTTAAPTTTTTSTTTTAAPTTTTTTTLASQKYLLTSCLGPGDIVGVFTITNAPLLAPGDEIRISGGGIAGYYCFVVNNTSTGTSLGTYSITDLWRGGNCENCSE